MQLEISIPRPYTSTSKTDARTFVTLAPASAAESAAASASWERRGVLQRLVRLDAQRK